MDLKNFLKTIKLQESTISLLVGCFVIVAVGVFALRFFSSQNKQEVLPPIQTTNEENLSSTYIVKEGDNLWTISEKYYGTGYNWVDIKEVNNLDDANEITKGQELIIPSIAPRIAQAENESVNTPTTAPTQSPQSIEKPTIEDSNNQENDGDYIVQEGDSLWKLAERYYNDGNKWTEISKANSLKNPSVISSGQKLNIPSSSLTSSTNTEKPQENENYTVQKGDSLWSIASSAYGDGNKWPQIANANKLVHPSVIHTGNQLTIPQ